MASVRLSKKEAISLGLMTQESSHLLTASPKTEAAIRLAKEQAKVDPQRILYVALRQRITGIVEWEKQALVEGRKYRVDIYLPESKVAIEFDGFQYHRSKTAFQNDRTRQNLLVLNGIAVLRYFNKQVMDIESLEACISQILSLHKSRLNL